MPKKLFPVLVFILLVAFFSSCGKDKDNSGLVHIRTFSGFSRNFNDLHPKHLAAARKIGIDPVKDRKEAKKTRGLVEIESNKYYLVEELTHSIPFLVKKADKLLEKIGEDFQDSLVSKNAPRYKIIVTSVTRTEQDVKKLRRSNVNASENSAHLYGTTFDLSYYRFEKIRRRGPNLTNTQLKSVLAEVLKALQKQKECYIKYEVNQHCFHITAR